MRLRWSLPGDTFKVHRTPTAGRRFMVLVVGREARRPTGSREVSGGCGAGGGGGGGRGGVNDPGATFSSVVKPDAPSSPSSDLQTHTHTHALTRTHTHTRTHSHTHTLTLTNTNTHAHEYAHTNTRTWAHNQTHS